MTIEELRTLSKAALPLNDDEWGSERQIDAENAVTAALQQYIKPEEWDNFEDYALKATTEEMVEYGMSLAENPDPRWQ